MTLLLCVLVLGGAADAAEAARARALADAWCSGKPYIGLSADEVVRTLGQPTVRRADAWEYAQPLGPGAHSVRLVRVVRFGDDGRVKSAAIEERGVGCILVEPRGR